MASQLREPLLPESGEAAPVSSTNVNNEQESLTAAADDATPPVDGATQDAAPNARSLLFYRLLFFLNGLSASAWGRFGVIYYNQVQHLTPKQIGILLGGMPLLSFFFQPLWGALSDMLQSRKLVYISTKIIGTLSLLAQALPSINSFGRLVWCCSCMSIFRSSGVLDAHCLDFLGTEHKGLYGTVRIYTAISWGLGAMIMGFITDAYGFGWNFALFGIMMFVMIVVTAVGLPGRSKSEEERYNRSQSDDDEAPNVRSLFKALLRIPILYWLIQVLIIGSGMALVDSFLFVYLQNHLNASTTLCGYTIGITVLFELPIFHCSSYLLKKVGHDSLFAISMAAYALRVFGYTFLTEKTVGYVLVLEITHGITFACMWIASIDYSAAVGPPEWATTVQSLLSTTFGCLSTGIGSIVGGIVLDRYGPLILYRGAGCIISVVLLIHLVMWLVCGAGHEAFLKCIESERNVTTATMDPTTDEEEHQCLIVMDQEGGVVADSIISKDEPPSLDAAKKPVAATDTMADTSASKRKPKKTGNEDLSPIVKRKPTAAKADPEEVSFIGEVVTPMAKRTLSAARADPEDSSVIGEVA